MWLKIVKALVALIALANMAWGGFALLRPGTAAKVLGFQLESVAARGEIRALYGGMLLALGLVTIIGLQRPSWLQALAIGWCGLVLGRLASLARDGYAFATLGAGAFELLVAVILFYASAKLRAAPPEPDEEPAT